MPLTLAILFLFATLVPLFLRRARRHAAPVCAAGLAVVLAAHPYTAWLLVGGLERQVPATSVDAAGPRGVDAIVILSGWMREGPEGRMTLAEDSTLRTLAGLDLYRELGGRTVVVTGGPASQSRGVPVARVMADRLIAEGVDQSDVLIEGRAATTHENAVYSAALLRRRGARRVALVTEALHMPRAARVFRAQGLDVVPVACNYLALRAPEVPWALLPGAAAAYGVHRGAHEWLGMAWYFLRGRFTPVAVTPSEGARPQPAHEQGSSR